MFVVFFYKYSEEVLRFRFEFREEFEEMEAKEIGRVVNKKPLEGGLYEWAAGHNSQIKTWTLNWLADNFTEGEQDRIGVDGLYAIFIKEYYKQKEKISERQEAVEKLNAKMREVVNFKAIKKYYGIHLQESESFDIRRTVETLPNGMKNQGLDYYTNQVRERSRCINIINAGIEKYGTLNFTELDKILDNLKEEKHKEQTELTRLKLNLENWDNIKYNCESEWGWGFICKEEKALAYTDEQLQAIKDRAARQKEKKERKKNSILGKFLY